MGSCERLSAITDRNGFPVLNATNHSATDHDLVRTYSEIMRSHPASTAGRGYLVEDAIIIELHPSPSDASPTVAGQ